MKKKIESEKAPSAIGPYSQGIAVEKGNLLFISGQLPVKAETGVFAGDDIASQTRQSILNLQAILESAGLSFDNVVKTTVFLKDIEDFAAMNEVYSQFFSVPYPARSAVGVDALPRGARVEIEAIAVL